MRRWSARRDHPRMSRNPAGTWTPTFPCPAGRTARRGAAIERQSPHGHPPVQVRLLRRTSRARGVTEAYAPCKRVAAVRIRAGPFGAAAGFLRPSLPESGGVVGGPSSLISRRPFSVAAWSRSRTRFLQIEAPMQLGELPSPPSSNEERMGAFESQAPVRFPLAARCRGVAASTPRPRRDDPGSSPGGSNAALV